jgi:hypothetical protein
MRKSVIIPILMVFARAYLAIINTLALMTKGNQTIISKKLKVGTFIISLITVMSCNSAPEKGPVTCYVDVPDGKITDSIEKVRKKDSLLKVQKEHQDSMMRNVTCYAKPCDNPNNK